MNPLHNKIFRTQIEKEFSVVINRNSLENESNTPDFLLAEYLVNCLDNFNLTARSKDQWKAVATESNEANTVISNGLATEEHPGLRD